MNDSSAAAQSDAPDENTDQAIRILVVVEEQKSITPCMQFLKRRGYEITTCSNIIESIRKLQTAKPHIVLVSWDLKKTDVRKSYKLFTDKFKLQCIAFSESTSTRTTAALMSSGIPDTLLAPLSGPAVHMKIQSILRRRTESENKETDQKTDFKYSIEPQELNPETKWAKVEGEPSEDGHHLFKGETPLTMSKKAIYYFNGPEIPKYNTTEKKWIGFEKGGTILTEEGYQAEIKIFSQEEDLTAADVPAPKVIVNDPAEALEKEFAELNEDSEFTPTPVPNIEEVRQTPEPSGNIITPYTRHFKKKENILSQCMREALEIRTKPSTKEAPLISYFSKIIFQPVETYRYKGYVVYLQSNDHVQKTFFENFWSSLDSKMKDKGEPLKIGAAMEIEISQTEYSSWVEKLTDFAVIAQDGDHRVVMAFVPVNALPHTHEDAHNHICSAELDWHMLPESVLLFNLYLFLPKNEKYILYYKKGALYTQAAHEKLTKYGVSKIFFKIDETRDFLAYCARNSILGLK